VKAGAVHDTTSRAWRELRDIASWWLYVVRYEARELWTALPGPWWAKVLLILATQAIPGPQDEILLMLVVGAMRRRRARLAARDIPTSRKIAPVTSAS
jgi:hypothetical protein